MNGSHHAGHDGFFYLSEVVDTPVLSKDGRPFGRLLDIGCSSGESYPRIVTYYLRAGWFSPLPLAVPAPCFAAVPARPLALVVETSAMKPAARSHPDEILLRREILDKQIVDTDGARVVRVNDIQLLRTKGGEANVVHVDIGYEGLLRRLGWEKALLRLLRLTRPARKSVFAERVISWSNVVPLRGESLQRDLRLNVTQAQLSTLHPAELAEIMEDMDRFEGPAMLQALDVPTAARTLAELSPEMQRVLIDALDVRKAASLIAAMPPDEEADLLAELPGWLMERVMEALPASDAATVTDLLAHEPDTAGSLMNPEVVIVPPGTSVGETVARMAGGPADLLRGHGVVVAEAGGRFVGIVQLADLVLADRGAAIEGIVEADPATLRPGDDMADVAEVFDRFNLLSAAVVGEDGSFEGIVTVDDVVAWLREGRGEGRGGG